MSSSVLIPGGIDVPVPKACSAGKDCQDIPTTECCTRYSDGRREAMINFLVEARKSSYRRTGLNWILKHEVGCLAETREKRQPRQRANKHQSIYKEKATHLVKNLTSTKPS